MLNKALGTLIAASLLMVDIPVVTLAASDISPKEQLNTELVGENLITNSERINLTSSSTQIPELENSDIESSTVSSDTHTEVPTQSTSDSSENSQTSEEATLSDTTLTSESPHQNSSTRAAVTEVGTWDAFVKAMKDTSVSMIKVTDDLTATSIGPTVTRTIDVDFDSHVLDLKSQKLTINSPGDLTIHNIKLTGGASGVLASGTGTLKLNGDITSLDQNAAGLAAMEEGTVIFDAVKMSYDRLIATTANPAIKAKNFNITNGSIVVSNAPFFFASVNKSTTKGAQVVIDGGSQVTTNNNKSSSLTTSGVWDIQAESDIWIKDSSSLELNGDLHGSDNNALMLITANATTLNVSNDSHLKGKAENSSVVLLQSSGGSFNVDGKSSINLVSNGENGDGQATLRFKSVGNMSFNVKDGSNIDITKTANSGISKSAPAIRMYGGDNKINVSGGSEFSVKRGASNQLGDPGSDGNNQAIQYTSGSGNEFNLLDKNSSVLIDSVSGPAIDGNASDMNITSGTGTYFVARGNTKSSDKGIFSAKLLNFTMDGINYFDFRNNHSGGGQIFGNTDAASKFSSKNSDFAVWNAGNNLDGEPTYQWFNVNFDLSGVNFGNLDSTDNSQMLAQLGSLTKYSRMSANNQAAVLDEIRVPTNADKYIYAHASVPEAKGEMRDAYTGEVQATIGVYDETGKEVAQVKGESIGSPLSVYGDPERKGLIKIDAPNKNFLKTDYTLKVLDSWRGENDDGWIHQSPSEDLTKDTPKVYDVTPADPVKLTNNQETIPPSAKEITGIGEAGDTLQIYLNNQNTNIETTVNAKGEFTATLPTGLKKGDVLQLFLKDHAGAANVTNPPTTNDSVGNIEPANDLAYHDAKFAAAKKLEINGNLELVSVPDSLDFGTQEVGTKTKTYYPITSGKLEVSDTRGTEKRPWELLLKEEVGLHSRNNDLSGLMKYTNKQATIEINQENQVVESMNLAEDGSIIISDQWNQNDGLSLTVPVGKQQTGHYEGKLSWTLEDVPDNN